VLAEGSIREQGTHETLMKVDGEYAELFRMQADGYEMADSALTRDRKTSSHPAISAANTGGQA
jgi:hypothetical protein